MATEFFEISGTMSEIFRFKIRSYSVMRDVINNYLVDNLLALSLMSSYVEKLFIRIIIKIVITKI